MVANAPARLTAGAPPPPSVLGRAAALGLEVMQVYGLTETYGHIAQCLWQEDWDALPPEARACQRDSGRDDPTRVEVLLRGELLAGAQPVT